VQVPPPTKVITPPERVQTAEELLATVITGVSPDVAVAVGV
jgi:hypothetical protein